MIQIKYVRRPDAQRQKLPPPGRCWIAGDFVAGPALQFPGRAALRAATGVGTFR